MNTKEQIAILMDELAPEEEFNQTPLSGVRIHRMSERLDRVPLCYHQGIYIIGNGAKQIYLGGKTLHYDANNYLVLTVPLPAECDGIGTPEDPLLGMMIDLDLSVINEIITEMESENHDFEIKPKAEGLFVSERNGEFQNAILRLLTSLQTPSEAKIVGRGIVHEIFYRVMCSENAHSLYSLATKNSNLARIDRALKQIHANYQDTMDVDGLAAMVHMSPSSFHRTFKEVTSTSPIQYLKRIRLGRARDLLVERGIRVNEAATLVGYESVPQFSREFKRIFGMRPGEVQRRAG